MYVMPAEALNLPDVFGEKFKGKTAQLGIYGDTVVIK
jgi:hypothetical protein